MDGIAHLVVLLTILIAWLMFVALIFWAVEYLYDRFHNQN